jgi:hypothetical protein
VVELTHGGTWLKWSSLNRIDRNWALLSFVTSGLAAVPVAIAGSEWTYALGYRAGSGGREAPPSGLAEFMASDLFAAMILVAAGLAVVSAIAWWRFSRNQDEMFNTIQNYALAQAGGWTFAIVFMWWLLSVGGWVGTLPLTWIVVLGTALLFGFWFQAVRRWA